MPLRDFDATFQDELRDADFAAAYLEAALEEGPDVFLAALRNVAKANGGMTHVSKAASVGRESLYKALSQGGNPEFRTVQSVLSALGMRLSISRSAEEAA